MYNSIIHNRQKTKNFHTSIVWYTYPRNYYLMTKKPNKLQILATTQMNLKTTASEENTRYQKNCISHDSIFMKVQRQAKQKADQELPGGGSGSGNCLQMTRRNFWNDGNVLKLDCGDGCTTL